MNFSLPARSTAALLLLLSICYFEVSNKLLAQCPLIEVLNVDACGDEGSNEYMIFNSGGGFNVNDLTVNYDSNNNGLGSGNENNDLNTNDGNSPTNPTPCGIGTGDISVYTGGCNFISVSPGDAIPASVLVIFQPSSSPTTSIDMSGLCPTGQTVYVIASDCPRGIGAFSNNGSGTRTTVFDFGGGCSETVTYDRSQVPGGNGGFYSPTVGYGNNPGCAPPPVAILCPAAENETLQICARTPTVSNEDISSAIGQFDATAISVTIHNTAGEANSGANPITTYSGSTASTVMLPVRVEYADGCIVISTLELDFVQPNVDAGNDNTETTCLNDPVNLNSLLSGGATGGGNWNSPDIAIGNPNSVDFSGSGAGIYNFTYSVTGPGTFCNTDDAMFTVTVNNGPQLNTPGLLNVCQEAAGNNYTSNLTNIIAQIGAPGTLNFYLNSNGTNPIDPSNDLTPLTPGVIFAIYEGATCPSNTVTINISYSTQPVSTAPNDPIIGCDLDGDGFFSFDLTEQTSTINGNSGETVTYYLDAAGTNEIFNPGNFNSGGDFVFAIVGTGDCRSESVAIELSVVMGPDIMGDITDVTCFGGDDGAITVNVTGTGSYTYSWSNDPFFSGSTQTMLDTRNYFVTVSDVNGCENDAQFFVDQPTQLMNTACIELDPASSQSAADGVARITVSGGTAPYTVSYQDIGGTMFTITGNGPTIDIPGLTAGTYSTFNITDDENCMQAVDCDFTITAPDACFLIDSVRTTAPLCNGEMNGTIQVFTSGEGGPLVVNWSEGGFPSSLSVLNASAGMYSVTLTDNSVNPACVVVRNSIIVLPTPMLVITCSADQDASGPGNADGQASIEISGGRAPYDLFVTGNTPQAFTDEPAGTINLNNLLAGVYNVMIMDDNGCESSCFFTIGEDAANCFNLGDETGFNATCFNADDATINIVVSDTTGPVTINWSVGPPGSEIPLPQFDNDLSITVGPGEYSYTISDAGQDASCNRGRGGIFRTEPDSIFIQCGELQAASTAVAEDGIATFLIGGRTFGDSLIITGPVDTILTGFIQDIVDLENIPAGIYQVVLRNGAGCFTEPCTFTITSPGCNLMVDTLVTQITCAGAMDGAISVIPTGNVGPLTYTWNDPAFNGDSAIMNLDTGTYIVTITQDATCLRELTINIAQPDSILLLCSSIQQTSTPFASDGIGGVDYSGGTAPYQITISGGLIMDTLRNITEPGDTTFEDLTVGVYNIEVTDANGCTESCQFTIGSAGCPLTATFTVENVDCNGADDGSISLMIMGNNGGTFVDWSDDAYDGQQDISNLAPGNYSATITDSGGCTFPIGPIMITEPDALTLTCQVNNPVSAPNAMDGSGQTTIIGGTGPFTVILQRFITPTFSVNDTIVTSDRLIVRDDLSGGNNPETTYAFVVIDANGCRSNCFFTIFEPSCPPFFIQQQNVEDINCRGDSTGRLEVRLVGAAVEPVMYEWIPALPDTNVQENLPAGVYTVIVTDANMCTAAQQFVLVEPSRLPEISCMALTDETGAGTMNGTAEVTLTGETAYFTVTIMGPNDTTFVDVPDTITQVLTGLESGMYTVFATDSTGCSTDTCSFEIGQGVCSLTASADVISQDCRTLGQVDVTVLNGLDPINYDWSVDSLDGNEDVELAAGNYSLTITDFAGCADTLMIQVDSIAADPLLMAMANITDQDCRTLGQVEVTVTSGVAPLMYDWSIDSLDGNDVVELTAGNYSVTVTDLAGCTDTLMIQVDSIPADPLLTAMVAITPADCSGNGLAEVTVAGNVMGVEFDWSVDSLDGMQDVELAGGNYTVTVSETGTTCQTILPVDVNTIDNGPTVSFATGGAVCVPESVRVLLNFTGDGPFIVDYQAEPNGPDQLTVTGADTLLFFPTDAAFGDILEITVFTVTDANGCTEVLDQTRNVTINYPDTIQVFEMRCVGDTVNVGGNLYDVNNPSDTFFVFTGDNCGELYEVDLDFIEAAIDTFRTTLCPGEPTELFGVIFDGNNPEQLVEIDEQTVTGCDSFLFVSVDFFPASQGSVSFSACRGDTIREFGRIFTFEDNSGIVILEGASMNSCDSLLAVTVNFREAPEVRLRNSASICQGESTDLRFEVLGSGNVDVSIIDQDGNIQVINGVGDDDLFSVSPDFTTTYSIVAANSVSPCPVRFSTDSVRVIVSRLSATLESDINQDGFQISCNNADDGGLTLVITEGLAPYDIQWSNGAFTEEINFLGPGNYSVTLTDDAGCQRTFSEFLQEPPPLVFGTRTLAPDCNSGLGLVALDTIFGGNGPYEVSLDGEFYQQITAFPFAQAVDPGTYTVYLQDATDCATTAEVFVPEPNESQVVLPPDTTVFLGDSVFIFAQTDLFPDTIIWTPVTTVSSPNSTRTYVTPLETTVYSIYMVDSLGCDVTADIRVTVDRRERIFVPNIFSPNSDGSNDLFRVFPGPGVQQVDLMQIFDRWGELVYEARDFDPNDPGIGWDGTLNGTEMNSAVFVFYLKATMVDGREFERKGDLVLSRR